MRYTFFLFFFFIFFLQHQHECFFVFVFVSCCFMIVQMCPSFFSGVWNVHTALVHTKNQLNQNAALAKTIIIIWFYNSFFASFSFWYCRETHTQKKRHVKRTRDSVSSMTLACQICNKNGADRFVLCVCASPFPTRHSSYDHMFRLLCDVFSRAYKWLAYVLYTRVHRKHFVYSYRRTTTKWPNGEDNKNRLFICISHRIYI